LLLGLLVFLLLFGLLFLVLEVGFVVRHHDLRSVISYGQVTSNMRLSRQETGRRRDFDLSQCWLDGPRGRPEPE
jgi:hypothetical protein